RVVGSVGKKVTYSIAVFTTESEAPDRVTLGMFTNPDRCPCRARAVVVADIGSERADGISRARIECLYPAFVMNVGHIGTVLTRSERRQSIAASDREIRIVFREVFRWVGNELRGRGVL